LAFLDPFHRNLSFRLIHNILPVKAKLRHIGFAVDLRCPHCGEDESLLHAFCDCRTVAPLWRLLFQFFSTFRLFQRPVCTHRQRRGN
jgi:hypothetical protein